MVNTFFKKPFHHSYSSMAHYFSESIFIVCISIVLNTVAELVSYIFVYGTDKYRNAKNSLSKVSLELAKKKDQIVSISEEKKHKKAIQKLKEEESTLKRNLTGMTTRINMICSMVLMMMMGVFRSAYSGVVVAKLPFEPIALFRGIFRAGLKKSTDPRDCCMVWLF